MTSEGHPYAVLQRALTTGNLWVAEAVARDMPHVPLEDAFKLVCLYAEKESPKFEKAALKWLRRYLDEDTPSLTEFAKVVAELVETPRAVSSGERIPPFAEKPSGRHGGG